MNEHVDRYVCEGGEVVLRCEDQQWGGAGFIYIVQALPREGIQFTVYHGTSINKARRIFLRECNYMRARLPAERE